MGGWRGPPVGTALPPSGKAAMKRFPGTSLALMLLCSAGLAASPVPQSQIARDVIDAGEFGIEITAMSLPDGDTAIRVRLSQAGQTVRAFLGSPLEIRLGALKATHFFDGVSEEALARFRNARAQLAARTIADATRLSDPAASARAARLRIVEKDIFPQALQSSHLHTESSDDCINLDWLSVAHAALTIAECSDPNPVSMAHCAILVAHVVNAEACQEAILKFLCESKGYPWKYVGQGWCEACWGDNCDMVVSALDDGGQRGPENQIAPSVGGPFDGGSWSYHPGYGETPGGTVDIGKCTWNAATNTVECH